MRLRIVSRTIGGGGIRRGAFGLCLASRINCRCRGCLRIVCFLRRRDRGVRRQAAIYDVAVRNCFFDSIARDGLLLITLELRALRLFRPDGGNALAFALIIDAHQLVFIIIGKMRGIGICLV